MKTFALLSALVSFVSAAIAAAPAKPNVVVILVDDFGYECVGANGGTSYRTPHIDRLAADGMRFERCFVQPLCTPTRVQLMTGIYNIRNYINFGNMDPEAETFAHHFRRAGYATGIAGKWQLGSDLGLPKKLGFDENCLWQHTRRPPRFANPGLEYDGVERDFSNGEYGPDLVQDWVLDFIRRKKDGPWLVYYPMILTHDPFQPVPGGPGWDPKAIGERVNRDVKYFADMVAHTDKHVGQLTAHLEQLGLRENTLFVFVGDNGTGVSVTSRMGDRVVPGGKGKMTAAGMHVPLIVSWPGKIPAGRVNADLIDSTDFLPTLLAAAGLPATKTAIDGRSFAPQLRGEPGTPREWYYSWYSRNGDLKSAREFAATQRYKLYRTGEFYDTTSDPEEKRPLPMAALATEAAAAAKKLQGVLAPFTHARPEKYRSIAPAAAGKAGLDE
ncbi:MAG: sulfatase-like hydrolase/transferase [Opitutaceae bacterium]|nr:sulfatase-like hydrolase/transferase [Opitutaceae bacterium]